MNGTEMLIAEMEKLDKSKKQIAEALLEEFKDHSNGLEKAWETRGLTIAKLMQMLTPYAKNELGGKSGAVDGDTVMGWVNHLIVDGDVPETKKEARENLNKEDEDEPESEKTEKAAKPTAAKKTETKKTKASKKQKQDLPCQQLSLFDFVGGASNGN